MKVDDTSEERLSREVQDVLSAFDLKSDDMKGHHYDNDSNKKGKHKRIPKKKKINESQDVSYTCSCHSFNLHFGIYQPLLQRQSRFQNYSNVLIVSFHLQI